MIGNWQPLADLLEDSGVVKVLHACSEDLEVLLRLTGKLPQPLFDTQLAAGYLNLGFSMGYSRLVQEVLGIELPKGETRSDWLQRPLGNPGQLRCRGCRAPGRAVHRAAPALVRRQVRLGAGGRCRTGGRIAS